MRPRVAAASRPHVYGHVATPGGGRAGRLAGGRRVACPTMCRSAAATSHRRTAPGPRSAMTKPSDAVPALTLPGPFAGGRHRHGRAARPHRAPVAPGQARSSSGATTRSCSRTTMRAVFGAPSCDSARYFAARFGLPAERVEALRDEYLAIVGELFGQRRRADARRARGSSSACTGRCRWPWPPTRAARCCRASCCAPSSAVASTSSSVARRPTPSRPRTSTCSPASGWASTRATAWPWRIHRLACAPPRPPA